jgi:CDP-diglyceride synthetase
MKTFYYITALWIITNALILTQLWIFSPPAALAAMALTFLTATPAYFVGLNEGRNND